MANIDFIQLQAAATPGDNLSAASTAAAQNDTSSSLIDGIWNTAESAGRVAQFGVGSIAEAAKDAVKHATVYDAAKTVGVGVAFAAAEMRFGLPGLVKNAATATVAIIAGEDILAGKWQGTFDAAADAWHSGENLKADIEAGRQGFGRSLVENAGLLAGMSVGARAARIAGSEFSLLRNIDWLSTKIPRSNLTGTAMPSTESTVPNLSRPVDSDPYKYFAQSRSSAEPQLYRWPNNEKPLAQQAISDVQRLDKSGLWHPNHREGLLREHYKGWFDEKADRIPHAEVQATIEKLLAGK